MNVHALHQHVPLGQGHASSAAVSVREHPRRVGPAKGCLPAVEGLQVPRPRTASQKGTKNARIPQERQEKASRNEYSSVGQVERSSTANSEQRTTRRKGTRLDIAWPPCRRVGERGGGTRTRDKPTVERASAVSPVRGGLAKKEARAEVGPALAAHTSQAKQREEGQRFPGPGIRAAK